MNHRSHIGISKSRSKRFSETLELGFFNCFGGC